MNSTLRTVLFGFGMATLGVVGAITISAHGGSSEGEGRSGAERIHRGAVMLPGARFVRAVSHLELTDAQNEMVGDMKEDLQIEMKSTHEGNREDMKGIADQFLSEGEIDRETLHALVDDHAAEKLALTHSFVDRVLDLRETLTPDQLVDLRGLKAKHEARGDEADSTNSEPSSRTRGRR